MLEHTAESQISQAFMEVDAGGGDPHVPTLDAQQQVESGLYFLTLFIFIPKAIDELYCRSETNTRAHVSQFVGEIPFI